MGTGGQHKATMPLVWKVVSAMVAEAGAAPTEAGMLRGARQYLENSYTNHVTATIHANRPQVSSSANLS